jgi:rRNA small subunit pseudouridine methyltransferase Nep1
VLNLVIAEAALELVPPEISRHASVRNDARRRELEPTGLLLDRSIHHAAMVRLPDDLKRGRPDLVHLTLLSVTSTPLYQAGQVKIYLHTRGGTVLELRERTRPPKSYSRFRDLMQQALLEKPDSGLITVYDSSVPRLLQRIGADLAIGLSVQGKPVGLEELASQLSGARNPVVLIGGFPKGHFTPETTKALDGLVRIDSHSLDAHVVAARLVYELEKESTRRGAAAARADLSSDNP